MANPNGDLVAYFNREFNSVGNHKYNLPIKYQFIMPYFAKWYANSTMRRHLNAGYSLLEMLICSAVATFVLLVVINSLQITILHHIKINQRFKLQHKKLIARHFLLDDLSKPNICIAACDKDGAQCRGCISDISQVIKSAKIKAQSEILLVYSAHMQVAYYLRESVIPTKDRKYALYRDDIAHNAQALVEEVEEFWIDVNSKDQFFWQINANLTFDTPLEIPCLISKTNMQTY